MAATRSAAARQWLQLAGGHYRARVARPGGPAKIAGLCPVQTVPDVILAPLSQHSPPLVTMSGRGKGKTAKKAVSRSAKAGLQFPVGRIARFLKAGKYASRVGAGAPVYLAAVLEYLAAEVLELAGNAARDNKKTRYARASLRCLPPAWLTPARSRPRSAASCPATSSWRSATTRSSPSCSARSPSPPAACCPTSTRCCCRRRATRNKRLTRRRCRSLAHSKTRTTPWCYLTPHHKRCFSCTSCS